MSKTRDLDDDECPALYYFPDGSSVGCQRFVHVGTDQPKPDEHLCEVTLRWTGEHGGGAGGERAKLAKLETLAREIHKNASHSDYGDGRWDMARRILDVLDDA